MKNQYKQNLPTISTIIISAVLKNQLNKAYKNVVNQTWFTNENVIKFWESDIIAKLKDENWIWINTYMDEFASQTWCSKYFTWIDKRVSGFIDIMLDRFSTGFF